MKYHTPNYTKLTSVSQAESKVTNKNENLSDLVNSMAFNDHLKQSVSTRQHSNTNRSSSNLYAVKLQSKILEIQKKIDTQRYQIDLLSAETDQFTQICEKQKYQLSNLNVQTLRGQYQQQINELVIEKQKITELIYNINEQYRLEQLQQETQLNILKERNTLLTIDIQRALSQKEHLLHEISKLDLIHNQNQQILLQQEQKIDQLRNIERKLLIALKDIEILQNKK